MSSTSDTIHVLHVDDEPSLSEMVGTFLEREDDRITVRTAANADEGLELLSTNEFDCIVSDYEMPGRNGIDFLELVREDYPDLPFLLYTGKGSEEVASDAISAGVTDYLQKESGADQYTILANRITNAVAQTRAVQEVSQTRAYFETILEHASDYIIVLDEHARIDYISPAVERVLGYTPENLQGTDAFEHIHPEDLAASSDSFADVLEQPSQEHTIEYRARHADGSWRWLGVRGRNRLDDPVIEGIIVSVRDITEQKEHERRLEQYEKIVETMDDVAFVVNDAWTVEFANESILEYVAGPFDALEGQPVLRLAEEYLLEADAPARLEQALERTFERVHPPGSPERLELTLDTDDEQVTFEYQLSPLVADGETTAVVITMRDITERKQQTERFQAFIEHSSDVITVLDSDGTYQYQSPSSERITGYEPEELRGETSFDYIHPEDRNRVLETVSEVVADSEMTLTVEYRFKHQDGSWRWFESTGNNQLTNPAIEGLVVNSRDITERKQQMEEIETLKDRLEFAIEGANLGVWDWDMTTDEVEFNNQWAQMLGYSLAELEPQLSAWETRVHPDDLDAVTAALDAHIDQQTEYYETEHRMRTAEGAWKWVRDIGKIVARDSDGEPIRAVGIHLDIDEAKQSQQELEQKTRELEALTTRLEAQYQTLFEEAPVMAVVTRTENGRPVIEDCNNQFADALKYETATLIGADLAEFYTPDSRAALIEGGGYERSLRGAFTKESRELVAADGEVVETVLRSVPRKDGSGEVVGTLAMYIDITEREEVKRANERLEEFSSLVSHDLRNPLNVASGRLELAREECESPHLEAVERAHGRMETLIVDLLTLAREGETMAKVDAVDLAAVVAECWENVETAESSLILETEQTIVADEPRLKQLFENLIRNAVEHGGNAVTVTVGGLADGFYIEDDGPGIPEADVKTVFEAGYSTNPEGTGFGLRIVQQIVQAHEWNINITSRSEGGARFEITGVDLAAG